MHPHARVARGAVEHGKDARIVANVLHDVVLKLALGDFSVVEVLLADCEAYTYKLNLVSRAALSVELGRRGRRAARR